MRSALAMTGVILICLTFSSVGVSGYYYKVGSMFINTSNASYAINLEQGYYDVIIDNSGMIGSINQKDIQVNIEVSFFGEEDNPLDFVIIVLGNNFNYIGFYFTAVNSVETMDIFIVANGKFSTVLVSDSERANFENELTERSISSNTQQQTITRTQMDDTSDPNIELFYILGFFSIIIITMVISKKSRTKKKIKIVEPTFHKQNSLTDPVEIKNFIICYKCQTSNVPTSKFCSECGGKL